MSKKNRSVSDELLEKVSGGDIFYDEVNKLWYVQDPEKGGLCYKCDEKSDAKKWAKDHNMGEGEISQEEGWANYENFKDDGWC